MSEYRINDIVEYVGDYDINDFKELYNIDEIETIPKKHKRYIIIDIKTDEIETLYTLKDIETGVICSIMFNDWEIETVKEITESYILTTLNNIEYYKNIDEFLKCQNMDIDQFKDEELNGFIIDITCGTYNGATNDFYKLDINDQNIIFTLKNALSDLDYYEHFEHEECEHWSNAKFIYEMATLDNIFIIEDQKNVYIDYR